MPSQPSTLELLMNRSGIFENYSVFGFQFRVPGGDTAWMTTSWPQQDPVHTFWIRGGQFYLVSNHMGVGGSDYSLIETHGLATDIDPDEARVLRKAIKTWEKQAL